ncbi:MAG: hypothetical protein V3V33_00325 [Candidatus Lokiarchaeia archaeon]
MRGTKNKVGFFLVILIVFSLIAQTSFVNLKDNSMVEKKIENLQHSGVSKVTNTRQWIKNGDFSSSDDWTSAKGKSGDPDDVDAIISGGTANYTINGESGLYSISGVPNSTWIAFDNPDWGVGMDEGTERGISNYGCWVDYTWDEGSDQTGGTPSVQWKRNITLPVNMSDYKITSASLNVTFNATVTVSPVSGGIDVFGDSGQLQVGDYARFYVLISDVENLYQPFQVANNRTKYLGWDTGSVSTIINTSLTNIDETLLINYLELILGVNSTIFTMTLGIDLYCEDNVATTDVDTWDKLRLNFMNLTFTYEKKIDEQTSVSWNQEGDKPSDIITNPFVIDEAILNFTYKVNDTLPKALSQNSEFQILINGFPHSETIKLWTAETKFQNASLNGFDVTRLIDKDKDINVSIRVYLADEFELNRTISFSIDDIYLNVTYTEDVTDIETKLQLFLDGIDKTDDPVISLPLGKNLNITVKYTNLTREHIPLAEVNLEGKVSGILDPDPPFDQYSLTINTNDLGIGVSILTITAEKTLYETNQTQFFVEVTERETELLLFLNGNPKNDGETFNIKIDRTVNITVLFRDNETKQHLPDALVELLGWDKLNETNNQYYNITINTNDLVKGINAFTIFAQLVNYTTNSINFFIEVFETATNYQLFLNNIDSTLNPLINLTVFDTLNITIKYLDNETGNHIPNATLQYIGGGLSGNLTEYETLEFYSKNISTNDLGIGVTIINVIAQKTLYETQNIQFFVEVTERETELLLFLNGKPKNDSDTIKVEIDGIINITVYFRDINLNNEHISNATVNLLNWDKLNETNNQYYNIIIDTKDLDQGITSLTVFAQLVNYEPQSINFFIEVIEKATDLRLILNGEEKTLNPVFNLTIGEKLNITIKYTEQAGAYVPNAVVQLIGEGISTNLTRDDVLKQHYSELDTADLKIGVNLFSVVARSTNYEIQTIKPIITISRISTLINISSQISAEPGDDATLKVILIDTYFGGTILNTTVTYRWAYGQGELVDLYNNGTYEGNLENVPEGTYSITITAFGSNDYDFETKEITLIVTSPITEPGPDLSWLVYVLIGAMIGLVVLFTLYQTHFKYPPMVRKIRKLKKNVRKAKRTKPILVNKRDQIINNELQNQIKIIEYEVIQPDQVEKIEKVPIKEGGED